MDIKFRVRDLKFDDGPKLIKLYYGYYDELRHGNKELGLTLFRKKPTYESEIDWFAGAYKGFLNGSKIAKVAEVGGKVVGLCDISTSRPDSEMDHVGLLGIAIMDGHRSSGIGTALIGAALKEARAKFEIVRLGLFAGNARAMALYKKMGFVEYGRMPRAIKRGKRYFDEVFMYMDFEAKRPKRDT